MRTRVAQPCGRRKTHAVVAGEFQVLISDMSDMIIMCNNGVIIDIYKYKLIRYYYVFLTYF